MTCFFVKRGVAVTVQDNTKFSSLQRTARRGDLKVSVKSKGVKNEIDSQGQIKFETKRRQKNKQTVTSTNSAPLRTPEAQPQGLQILQHIPYDI